MSPWKVILATLVIFTAGLFTGAVGMRQLAPPPPKFRPSPDSPFQPWMLRDQFVKSLSTQMELTPEQRDKIGTIVHESQQRTRILTSLIEPEMREELRNTRQAIREVLTPAQREQYEEILKKRSKREKDGPRGREQHGGAPFSGAESNRDFDSEARPPNQEPPGRLK